MQMQMQMQMQFVSDCVKNKKDVSGFPEASFSFLVEIAFESIE
jgi:hypothetical protein